MDSQQDKDESDKETRNDVHQGINVPQLQKRSSPRCSRSLPILRKTSKAIGTTIDTLGGVLIEQFIQ